MLKLASPKELAWGQTDGVKVNAVLASPQRKGLILVDFKLESAATAAGCTWAMRSAPTPCLLCGCRYA